MRIFIIATSRSHKAQTGTVCPLVIVDRVRSNDYQRRRGQAQLRKLEDQVDAKLIYRNKRRVSLTRAGEAFPGEARRTVAQMEHAAQLAHQIQGRGGRASS